MNYPKELCELIIKNMDIIEQAPNVADSVEEKLFNCIDNQIEARVKKETNDWSGIYSICGKNGETWFCPNHWKENDDKIFYAWYGLTYIDGPNANDRYLSRAMGVQESSLCLFFYCDRTSYDMNFTAYKKELKSFLAKNNVLQKAGFILHPDENKIALPFKFDANLLAEECPDDFDKALAPLDTALDTLFRVHSEFDMFVKSLGTPKE